LRAAIEEINALHSSSKITIQFAVGGAITPQTQLPDIKYPTIIDANPSGDLDNVSVELAGSALPPGTNGLVVRAPCDIRGLSIHSFQSVDTYNGFAVLLAPGSAGSTVEGNLLGLKPDGQPAPNAVGLGIASAGNTISNNAISANNPNGIQIGMKIDGQIVPNVANNVIQGNYIGTNATGTKTYVPGKRLGNKTGILATLGAEHTTIGGNTAAEANVISGNRWNGIVIDETAGGLHEIRGNKIGTDKTGTVTDPNGFPGDPDDFGNVEQNVAIMTSQNTIGGTTGFDANVIAGSEYGVIVWGDNNTVQGNLIGTDITGSQSLGNEIGVQLQGKNNKVLDNTISGNTKTGLGIFGKDAEKNVVEGNFIGTDKTGGTKVANGLHGVEIANASENTLEGNTISGNIGCGVFVYGGDAKKNTLLQNTIGTNWEETAPLANRQFGVLIHESSDNDVIENVLSGNYYDGLAIVGNGNEIYGNYIGTNEKGDPLQNMRNGILIWKGSQNSIGEASSGPLQPTKGNVIQHNREAGIKISESDSTNWVRGNTIDQNKGAGVLIADSRGNQVGGTSESERNVISANWGGGVLIQGKDANHNYVQGNYIGTDADGNASPTINKGNWGFGVMIDNSSSNVIGGITNTPGKAPGNIIADSKKSAIATWVTGAGVGVWIKGEEAKSNKVQGNLIGRNPATGKGWGNEYAGVFIEDAPENTIGEEGGSSAPATPDPKKGNLIAENENDGVRVDGDKAIRNTIRLNQIFKNEGLGINLVGGQAKAETKNGVTPNDKGDTDAGPNDLLNFPVGVTAGYDAAGNKAYVSGVLPLSKDTINQGVTVDLYYRSAFGEGWSWLDYWKSYFPTFVFEMKFSGSAVSYVFSATVTDNAGSTSEFSPVSLEDSDGDGLADEWEEKGIDFDGDGEADLALKGAKKGQKDIFLEIDYMMASPPTEAMSELAKIFLDAPVDGNKGIHLHFEEGEQIHFHEKTYFDPTDGEDNGSQ